MTKELAFSRVSIVFLLVEVQFLLQLRLYLYGIMFTFKYLVFRNKCSDGNTGTNFGLREYFIKMSSIYILNKLTKFSKKILMSLSLTYYAHKINLTLIIKSSEYFSKLKNYSFLTASRYVPNPKIQHYSTITLLNFLDVDVDVFNKTRRCHCRFLSNFEYCKVSKTKLASKSYQAT